MRQKLGMAAVLGLVAAIWVVGFLLQRGAAPPVVVAGPASAPTAATEEPSPAASETAEPDASGSPGPRQQRPEVDRDLVKKLRAGIVPPDVDTVVATLNLLGSSHTVPGGSGPGHYPGYAVGTRRAASALALLDREQVSLVGLQEVQGDQARVLAGAAGWRMYPDVAGIPAAGQNAVMWRDAEWELVRAQGVAVPYFGGQLKQMPLVLLRHRETGVTTYLSSFHNPATTRRVGQQGRWRAAAADREVALLTELRASGVPHLVTGDFNERADIFCRISGATGFTSPAGGSTVGGCQPPADMRIDWIFGDPEIQWTRYAALRDAAVRGTTDHPLVVAGARISAADFPKAWADPGAG